MAKKGVAKIEDGGTYTFAQLENLGFGDLARRGLGKEAKHDEMAGETAPESAAAPVAVTEFDELPAQGKAGGRRPVPAAVFLAPGQVAL